MPLLRAIPRGSSSGWILPKTRRVDLAIRRSGERFFERIAFTLPHPAISNLSRGTGGFPANDNSRFHVGKSEDLVWEKTNLLDLEMIDENSPDDLRAEGEEVRAVFAFDATRANQLEIRLVGDGGRFQGVVAAPQMLPGDPP